LLIAISKCGTQAPRCNRCTRGLFVSHSLGSVVRHNLQVAIDRDPIADLQRAHWTALSWRSGRLHTRWIVRRALLAPTVVVLLLDWYVGAWLLWTSSSAAPSASSHHFIVQPLHRPQLPRDARLHRRVSR
jgi:hypothetical protein